MRKNKEDKQSSRKSQAPAKKKDQPESKTTNNPIRNSDSQLRSFRKGYVEMRYRNCWKYIYVILIGGSFHMYHNSTDSEPFSTILLSRNLYNKERSDVDNVIHISTDNLKDINRVHYFVLYKEKKDDKVEEKKKSLKAMLDDKLFSEEVYNKKLADISNSLAEPEILFVGSFPGAVELRLWKEDIKKALDQNIESAPRASSTSNRITKFPKPKGQRYTIDHETQQILNSLKYLVQIYQGPKRSEQLEKNLVKLTVKSFSLICSRQIKPEEFMTTDKLMKNVFEFLVKIYNAKKLVQKEAIMSKALEKVETLLKESEKNLLRVFEGYPKVKALLPHIFIEFNVQFFQKILFDSSENPEIQKHVEKMVDAMGKYTQFQYNS